MHEYGQTNWEGLWEKLEQSGNVGITYVINPHLYPEISSYIATHPKALVVDFGCGTNIMGIELLFGYVPTAPALQASATLGEARFNTLLYLGIEGSHELVDQSHKYLHDIGDPKNVATVQAHIGKELNELFDENSIDLCVSRNFVMHLSPEDFDAHLQYVARMLKPNGAYIFATLTPPYELQKAGSHTKPGDRYDFQHGKSGEYGIFYHYYKPQELYDEVISKYFIQEKRITCTPITDAYKNTHARYYDADVPMAYVYVLKKK
jgi:SAM-dependent methyltransferase